MRNGYASMTFSDGSYYIPVYAFSDGKFAAIKSISFAGDPDTIGAGAFAYCLFLQSVDLTGLTSISPSMFEGVPLQSVRIPDSVETMGEYAFAYCEYLAQVSLSSNLTEIAEGAFYGTALESIVLPEKVTKIGVSAFEGTSLESIYLANVTDIGRTRLLWHFAYRCHLGQHPYGRRLCVCREYGSRAEHLCAQAGDPVFRHFDRRVCVRQ